MSALRTFHFEIKQSKAVQLGIANVLGQEPTLSARQILRQVNVLMYIRSFTCCTQPMSIRQLPSSIFRFKSQFFFREYEILAVFPIQNGVWEILISARYISTFSKYAREFGFTIERNAKLLEVTLYRWVALTMFLWSKYTQISGLEFFSNP